MGALSAPEQAEGGAGPSLVTPLGCSQDLGQVYLQQDQLATSAGQWESGIIQIKSPLCFCEEAGGLGLEGWVMCNSKGPHFLRLAGRSPVCPQSLPESGSQDFCCPRGPGCGPGTASPR